MLEQLGITIEQFEKWSLTICLSAFVLYLCYIIYKLGREAKAGRYGFFILSIALGAGVIGFVAKEVIKVFLE